MRSGFIYGLGRVPNESNEIDRVSPTGSLDRIRFGTYCPSPYAGCQLFFGAEREVPQ